MNVVLTGDFAAVRRALRLFNSLQPRLLVQIDIPMEREISNIRLTVKKNNDHDLKVPQKRKDSCRRFLHRSLFVPSPHLSFFLFLLILPSVQTNVFRCDNRDIGSRHRIICIRSLFSYTN